MLIFKVAFFLKCFFFYHLSFLCNAYGHFPSKILRNCYDLGFWIFCTKLWYDKLYWVLKNAAHIAYQSLYLLNKSFSQTIIYVTDLISSCLFSQNLQILHTLRGWPRILSYKKFKVLIFILPSINNFSFFTISYSYVMHMDIFRQRFLRNCLT